VTDRERQACRDVLTGPARGRRLSLIAVVRGAATMPRP
jgi:hypothetical protein